MGGAHAAVPARYGRRVTATPSIESVAPRRVLVVDNYDSFVFNIVQYLAQLGAECTVVRNDEVDLGECPAVRRRAAEPRTRHPGKGRGLCRAGARDRRVRAGARRLPRTPGDCRGLWRRGGAGTGAAPRQDQRGGARGCRCARGPSLAVHRDALSLPVGARRFAARRARGHRTYAGRRDHGAAAPRPAPRRGAVSPRVSAHRGWSSTPGQLADDLRRRRRRASSEGLAPVVSPSA